MKTSLHSVLKDLQMYSEGTTCVWYVGKKSKNITTDKKNYLNLAPATINIKATNDTAQ